MIRHVLVSALLLTACHPNGGTDDGGSAGDMSHAHRDAAALHDGASASDAALDGGTPQNSDASTPADGASTPSDGGITPVSGDFCLAGNWCWQRPQLFGTSLAAVWGGGPSDVWSVGSSGTVIHYDGTKWALVQSGTSPDLTGVWGTSATNVWFVGLAGTLLHYDGKTISTVPSGTTWDLYGVGGSSPTDVYAVGANDTRLQYDGKKWTLLPTVYPNLVSPIPLVNGVWTNGGNVFTSGDDYDTGQVAQRIGGTWQAVDTEDTDDEGAPSQGFVSVWGSSDTDVWLTGSSTQHWDGKAWTYFTPPTTTPMFEGGAYVTGTAANDVWFFGAQLSSGQWDGKAYHPAADLTGEYLAAGWVHPSGAAWVVGPAGRLGKKTTVGGGWSFVSGATEALYLSLSSLQVIGEDDIWAAGRFGFTHWDGKAWTDVAPAKTVDGEEFTGIWGSATNDLWATAWGSESPDNLQHWDGKAWSTSAHPGPSTLNAVWGAASDDVWVTYSYVDANAMHWDGKTWTIGTSSPTFGANAIMGTSGKDIWAVGESGGISHYDGTTWTTRTSGTMNDLYSVLAITTTDVWVGGNASTLMHYNGSTWTSVTVPTIAPDENGNRIVYHLAGTSPDLWLAASDGHVFHYDGKTWTISTQATVALATIARTPSGALFIAGNNGSILRRAP